jgi:hypothetical protein
MMLQVTQTFFDKKENQYIEKGAFIERENVEGEKLIENRIARLATFIGLLCPLDREERE